MPHKYFPVEPDGDVPYESLGRNGWTKTFGIEVDYTDKREWGGRRDVCLQPHTTRGAQSLIVYISPEVMTEITKWWLAQEAANG